MYDTVKLWLPTEFAFHVPERLSDRRTFTDEHGEISTQGRLGNLTCIVKRGGILIWGSLAKFYKGNNFEQLSREEKEEAFEEIGKRLSIPVNSALVRRVDIGATFIMANPCAEYLPMLGRAQYYRTRVEFGRETVKYLSTKKTLTFYDKIKEAGKAKEAIPSLFTGKPVLRYEQQNKNRLSEIFKQKPVTVSTLRSKEFYRQAVSFWLKDYELIQKLPTAKLSGNIEMASAKDLERYLAKVGLEEIGTSAIRKMIDDMQEAKELERMQAKRLRDKLRDIEAAKDLIEASAVQKELDEKIREAARRG